MRADFKFPENDLTLGRACPERSEGMEDWVHPPTYLTTHPPPHVFSKID
jgi:hypothetical protein